MLGNNMFACCLNNPVLSMLGFRDGPIGFNEYYSQLWEHIADILGGVIRTKKGLPYPYETSSKDAAKYWAWAFFS